MDILIKNLKLPKEMECLEILLFHDGYTTYRVHERDEWTSTKAIEVKPYERLIEARFDYAEFKKRYEEAFGDNLDFFNLYNAFSIFNDMIVNAPTVLEASNG